MSGPKVVRVITRDEIIAACRTQLARVNHALAEWVRTGRRHGCVSAEEEAAAHKRRDALNRLLESDSFAELQNQASLEVEFLNSDLQSRLAKVAERQARERMAKRRQADAGRALLKALRKGGKLDDAALETRLERVANGEPDDRAMSEAFALLSSSADDGRERRKALAEQYRTGEASLSLSQWLQRNGTVLEDSRLTKLGSRIAELHLHDPAAARLLEEQLEIVEATQDQARRGLLVDSLEIDTASALRQARELVRSQEQLGLALAELSSLDAPAAENFRERDLEGATIAMRLSLLQDVSKAVIAAKQAAAAKARRSTILKGLTKLGYEVSDGMETAWVRDGRIVLRNALRPDYGVEIGGEIAAERIQMRPIAFEGAIIPSPGADASAEIAWCGEVAELGADLAAAGGSLIIERTLPVGATPLKRVRGEQSDDRHRAREGPNLKGRTLG